MTHFLYCLLDDGRGLYLVWQTLLCFTYFRQNKQVYFVKPTFKCGNAITYSGLQLFREWCEVEISFLVGVESSNGMEHWIWVCFYLESATCSFEVSMGNKTVTVTIKYLSEYRLVGASFWKASAVNFIFYLFQDGSCFLVVNWSMIIRSFLLRGRRRWNLLSNLTKHLRVDIIRWRIRSRLPRKLLRHIVFICKDHMGNTVHISSAICIVVKSR